MEANLPVGPLKNMSWALLGYASARLRKRLFPKLCLTNTDYGCSYSLFMHSVHENDTALAHPFWSQASVLGKTVVKDAPKSLKKMVPITF
jgi:hypothetical protein